MNISSEAVHLYDMVELMAILGLGNKASEKYIKRTDV